MKDFLLSPELQKNIKKIIPILKKNDVIYAGVFGSFARGKDEITKESDIDILIDFKIDVIKSLLDIAGIKIDIEDELNRKVDIVTRKGLNPKIKKYVFRDLIQIYEKRN